MIVRAPAIADLNAIACNLRAESAAEAFASMPHDDRKLLGDFLVFAARNADYLACLCDAAAAPRILIGTMARGPGKAGMIYLAADGAEAIALAATRWWHSTFVPEILMRYRRVEFVGSPPGTRSGHWLASMGFECEGIARAYHKDGSDFGHWAWINPNYHRAAPVDDADAGLRCSNLTDGSAAHV